jgi:hypothetical protein
VAECTSALQTSLSQGLCCRGIADNPIGAIFRHHVASSI